MPFLAGLLLGILTSTLVGGLVVAWLLRKSRLLERRTAEAERLGELGTLTGGLAHEIKNPLSTLQLNLQLLREDMEARQQSGGGPGETDPEMGRMLRRLTNLTNETTRLREILDDFLRYAGRIEVEARPTDLKQLADELVDFLLPQAQLARVRLQVGSNGPARALADPRLIKQALLNLLLNALQHTPEGGTVGVEFSPERSGRAAQRSLEIRVSDTGSGVEPQDIARIFEPYFTRRRGGTGLGLATTRRIVQAHGGTISVQSAPGQGSRFVLTLPAA